LASGISTAVLLAALAGTAHATATADPAARAASITISRDDWGIAHIHGKTDADAVFGMIYAQAEDDFNRVETNYLTALGRTAEAEGEGAIWEDLRARLYVDEADLKARYGRAPTWLKGLSQAWADGLNYYLATHPQVKPKVITRFEPWMALSFSEGSIGGDIERIEPSDLAKFYGKTEVAALTRRPEDGPLEPRGSNGFAIGPRNTADHHAILWINPHTSFYFRSEAQVTSDEGLNVYGASTWGQFFVYQGFNAKAGWMHTSSGADVVDEFEETIVRKDGKLFYKYGKGLRPVQSSVVAVPFKTASGATATRSFTVYHTHHGPIIRGEGDKWISFAMMYKPVEALEQSFLRTRATDYASFKKVAELKANSSNNTIFADAKGEIAYMHPHFIPRRDDHFDYTRPVDGSNPATDWKGLMGLDEAPHLLNPPNGWLYNTNNWPYSAAGAYSPKRANYPAYMDTFGENPRGIHADLVLKARHDFTPKTVIQAAFDPYLPAFATLIPTLTDAWDKAGGDNPLKARLAEQIELLRKWDDKWSADSEATTLAALWGDELWPKIAKIAKDNGDNAMTGIAKYTSPNQKLEALAAVVDRLQTDYGTWHVAWGKINRFQRLTADIKQPFNDDGASIPVPFTSANWGSLASFGAKRYPGTKNYYGTSGNSFLAAVEFGPRVKAFAVSAGGESGDPASKHFKDQAERYASGNLRQVYFYPDELKGHVERVYHPGE
jgi:acyl-homoserine-lactone acylase